MIWIGLGCSVIECITTILKFTFHIRITGNCI